MKAVKIILGIVAILFIISGINNLLFLNAKPGYGIAILIIGILLGVVSLVIKKQPKK